MDTDSDSLLISKLIANDYTFRALALGRLSNDPDYSGSAILLFYIVRVVLIRCFRITLSSLLTAIYILFFHGSLLESSSQLLVDNGYNGNWYHGNDMLYLDNLPFKSGFEYRAAM